MNVEEVHHPHLHHLAFHQQQQQQLDGLVGGRLTTSSNAKNLLSTSVASMASLAASVGATGSPPSSHPSAAANNVAQSGIINSASAQQPLTNQSSHLCGGCGHPIKDRYLLQALDSYWHEDCLKCSCCGCRLGEVGSNLFTKADLILCKRDYLRLFGATGSCAACCKPIPAFEMVMRAKSNVYHLDCFACQQCHQRFCVGDRFYLCDNQILCEYDYEERLIFANLATSSGCHPAQFNNRGAPPPPPPPAPPQPPMSQAPSSQLHSSSSSGHPQQQQTPLVENGTGSYGRPGEANHVSNNGIRMNQQQRNWNGPLSNSPSTTSGGSQSITDMEVEPSSSSTSPTDHVTSSPATMNTPVAVGVSPNLSASAPTSVVAAKHQHQQQPQQQQQQQQQQQDSPAVVEHDASSSGYGSPDSGGLIDEG